MNLLIADDSLFMRKFLKDSLEPFNFDTIFEAVDGIEAVNKYKDTHPDLVLLDLNMPYMAGMEALEIIKNFDSNAHVIIVTTMGNANLMERAYSLGAENYLIKPFTYETLRETIERYLTKH